MRTVDSLPFISKMKEDKYLDFSKLNRFKGIITGQAVRDYLLFFHKLIPSFELKSFEIYFSRRTGKFDYEKDPMAQYVRGEYGIYDSLNAFWEALYPLNIEQAAFFKGRFIYSEEFGKLLSTRQLGFTFYSIPEISLIERLLEKRDQYSGHLYLNWDMESAKLACVNTEKGWRRKNMKDVQSHKDMLDRKFSVKYRKDGYILSPKEKTEFSEDLIPYKDRNSEEYRRFVFDFWDILYSGCSRLERFNFELVSRFSLQSFFSRKAYKKLKTQLKESDFRLIKKFVSEHDLSPLIWREDILQTLENFSYLKLLENDYGIQVIGNLEIYIRNSHALKINILDFHEFLISPNTFRFKDMRRVEKRKKKTKKDKSRENKIKSLEDLLTEYIKKLYKKGFWIKPLKTEVELQTEGRDMKHCVGGYYLQVNSGNSKIFSLSWKKGTVRSTVEISKNLNGWYIRQNKGFQNSVPDDTLKAVGEDLCRFINSVKKECPSEQQ